MSPPPIGSAQLPDRGFWQALSRGLERGSGQRLSVLEPGLAGRATIILLVLVEDNGRASIVVDVHCPGVRFVVPIGQFYGETSVLGVTGFKESPQSTTPTVHWPTLPFRAGTTPLMPARRLSRSRQHLCRSRTLAAGASGGWVAGIDACRAPLAPPTANATLPAANLTNTNTTTFPNTSTNWTALPNASNNSTALANTSNNTTMLSNASTNSTTRPALAANLPGAPSPDAHPVHSARPAHPSVPFPATLPPVARPVVVTVTAPQDKANFAAPIG
ncbi:hypothetical protein AMAG_19010 [Allomyces macrogynus ATCC 38327]|uniref:Uncharacterized protein n=1 Tax=Allomyces macrogynus (strain ATCC 38327) TaxID=578462 RepID=A0A0L0SLY5_ALLM3|nr:hypothetical protein AMAG_19010 [Allomyces macrogynus ATCC 38327]|eukprot:KNE63517.1 hypothetical protein AMAG_19010 [Allomyces macrogynus ATCC 38327]